MLHEQRAPVAPPPAAAVVPSVAPTNDDDNDEAITFRDIHPLTPDVAPTPPTSWDAASLRSFSSVDEQYFMTMSREFTAMVAAGATMQTDATTTTNDGANANGASGDQLASIGEDEPEETNPTMAIVTPPTGRGNRGAPTLDLEVVPVEAGQVKKEEVQTKVSAWRTAEMAKINNRFKREELVINGWETEQVENASAWLKKIERKLDEQRARAVEKTQNDIAKARRGAEEKRASAEAKRGLKLAKVLELANFMKAVGRVPTKRSFF